MKNYKNNLISHNNLENLNLTQHRERITTSSNLAFSVTETLELLDQLLEFELGLFILNKKGLNGYWTSYVIQKAFNQEINNPLEKWLIYSCPATLATRERFGIFQQQLKKYIRTNMTIASIPCGIMDDLLLNEESFPAKMLGIDLDDDSLNLAKANALKKGREQDCTFLLRDAWKLEINNELDIITSNGLNIYEPDKERVIELYNEFFKALKKGGILITSFLTPPPILSKDSTWTNFNPPDLLKQKALFNDVIQVGWQSYQTEMEIKQQLAQVGFNEIDIIYDSQGMFPTVVAKKR